MKLLFVTFGSRGDVEPFVHLSAEAVRRGHDVVVLTTAEFHHMFPASVHFESLPGSVVDLVAQTGASPRDAAKIFSTVIRPLMVAGMETLRSVADDLTPDVIVYHPKIVAAPIVSRSIGARAIQAEFAPITVPTREFASAGVGVNSWGPLNRLSYLLASLGSLLFRKELRSLAASRRLTGPSTADATLVAVSPTVVPRPHDYPSSATVTGQWSNPSESTPAIDPAIRKFLVQPTVAVTFGSMSMDSRQDVVRSLVNAIRAKGLRALVISGWTDASFEWEGIDDVLVVDSAPHDLVFPLCRGVIHHGGAGTTHAAARAGVPQWIVPIIADQPWWAQQVQRLGIGAVPEIKIARMNQTRAEIALDEFAGLASAALSVAEQMRTENGCSTALDVIERVNLERD